MKKVVALLALVLAAATLVACGDDSGTTTSSTTESGSEAEPANGATAGAGNSEGGGGESTVSLEADPDGQLAYTPDTASAQAGNIKIDFNNPQSVEHDVDVEDSSGEDIGETELITNDSTSVTLQDVKPGDYTFYCSVPGHREAGMEGTLTVE